MNKQVIKEILRKYEIKRDKASYEQQKRKEEVYTKVPKIKKIDKETAKTGLMISKAILSNPEDYDQKIEEIKTYMEQLKQEKAILLTENNIPLEYLDMNYECNKCKDTGFLKNGGKCSCFKQELINRAYKMSNLAHALKKENFQTFNIDIFSKDTYEEGLPTPRENMTEINSICEGFVHNFDEDNEENLLMYGTTGLGKTFMCNCIAKALLDKGKIVVYQTAFNILEILREHRFNNTKDHDDTHYTMLFDADLLIIDDLGTELTNSFTNTEIFNIVNSRLIKGKKTIISTNLLPMQIAETYTDRVFSRIFSQFSPLKFYGPDLRWDK